MFKTVIPELISFETELKTLNGFIMCQNFDYFPSTPTPHRFHFRLIQSEKLQTPSAYDFRSEYNTKINKTWYQERKILFWQPKFQYETTTQTFSFNQAYQRLPFRLGGMFSLGEFLCNLIDLQLFLQGFVIMRGIAFNYQNKNIGLSAPGLNGKTTFLKSLLQKGARYIAEDYLVLDLNNNLIYPTCPLLTNIWWQGRHNGSGLSQLLDSNSTIQTPVPLDELFLVTNSLDSDNQQSEKKISDFVLLNSLYFLNNLFVRSYIFDNNLTETVLNRLESFRHLDLNYKFISLKNFNYNFL